MDTGNAFNENIIEKLTQFFLSKFSEVITIGPVT